jgi:hypothetical protein
MITPEGFADTCEIHRGHMGKSNGVKKTCVDQRAAENQQRFGDHRVGAPEGSRLSLLSGKPRNKGEWLRAIGAPRLGQGRQFTEKEIALDRGAGMHSSQKDCKLCQYAMDFPAPSTPKTCTWTPRRCAAGTVFDTFRRAVKDDGRRLEVHGLGVMAHAGKEDQDLRRREHPHRPHTPVVWTCLTMERNRRNGRFG